MHNFQKRGKNKSDANRKYLQNLIKDMNKDAAMIKNGYILRVKKILSTRHINKLEEGIPKWSKNLSQNVYHMG